MSMEEQESLALASWLAWREMIRPQVARRAAVLQAAAMHCTAAAMRGKVGSEFET